MQTTFRPDEDPEYIPSPAACPPPPLSDYPDGPTLAEMEAAIVMGSCAFCGATRPMAELEYVHFKINGEIIKRYFCYERKSPQSWRPIHANFYLMGAEG